MQKIAGFLFSLTLGFIFVSGTPAHAQMPDYHVQVFDQKDGVNSSKIVDMVRDGEGFLWLLYRDRICRFDGKRVKKFELQDHFVSIKKDKNGGIWANSISGLYKFKNDREGFLPIAVDTTGSPRLISMISLPGKKWRLLTNRGIYRYSPTEKKFLSSKNLTINNGEYILKFSYGLYENTLFYASNDSIVSLNLKTGENRTLYCPELYRFHVIDKNSLLVSDWKGKSYAYDFSKKSIEQFKYISNGKNAFLGFLGICELKNKDYLLATFNDGLIEYNQKNNALRSIKLFHNGQPFTNFKIISLYRDEWQNIWVATDNGLVLFNLGNPVIGLFRNWEESPEKAFSEQIRNFAPDGKGNLWLATQNGFAHLDLKTGKVQSFHADLDAKDRLNHPSVRGLVYDGKYLIIGQSNYGIWLYDPDTKKYTRPPNTPILEKDDFIDQIYTLKSGDHVVVARDEVYVMNGKTYHLKSLKYPGEDENPMFCFQDAQDRVWIGSGNHVYLFDANLDFLFEVEKEWDDYVYGMCQWGENEYFLGSKGLYKLTLKNKKIQVEQINLFPKDVNITILYKDKQEIWLGTDDGIFSFDPSLEQLEKYGYFDNVQPGRFYRNSFYRFPNGPLFMGGIAGFNYFYPEKIEGPSDSLQVSFLKVNVNGEEVGFYPKFSSFDLDHTQKDIEISFSTPCFNDPNRVVYRYKMQGLGNGKWLLNGSNNKVRFTSLPPGDYSFSVAASINKANWYESGTPLYFSIAPPFWQTWWFIGLLILLAGTGLYFWIRNLRNRIHEEEILTHFATSLFGQNTVEETFWAVARNCILFLGFEDCVIYQYDEKKEKLIQKAAAGPKGNPAIHKVYDAIEIPIGKGIVGMVAKTQQSEIIKDTRKDPRYILDDQKRLSEISVPIIVEGKTFGVIDSEHSEKAFYKRGHLRMLERIAALCSEKISKYLIAEGIRTKIAQDLHDDMGSTLTSINIISKIAMKQTQGNENIHSQLKKIKKHSGQMMESMDDIIWAINPAHDTLDEIGLHMKEYAAELMDPTGIEYSFKIDDNIGKISFGLSQRKDLFLVFKEALNNALKYSKAKKIDIQLKKENKSIILSVRDNGKGFNQAETAKGNGLENMKTRAKNMGGSLLINSEEGKGAELILKTPIT